MKNKSKRKEIISIAVTVVLCIIGILLCIYNVLYNDKFFKVSVTSLLTIFIAVIFSYWFVQRKNDKRNKNEKIDKMVYKIQEIVCGSDFISSVNEDMSRKNLIRHRSVANKITYLKDVCGENNEVKSAIIEIEKEFESFREFYGNHYKDQEYMEKSQNELFNYITKIDDKADEIHVMLL